jgi:(p)ppGpp synthase/HD superfamily hydrolase
MRLTPLTRKALDFSALIHKDQLRVGLNVPYIVHPVAVMAIVSHYTNDEEVLSAALLHDVIEDSDGYARMNMERDFGRKVAELVSSVSENKYDASGKVRSWQDRKASYLHKLSTGSKESWLICVVDTIHNIESLLQTVAQCGNEVLGQFGAGLDRKIVFYEHILRTIGGSIPNELRERLVSLIEELRKFC